jgi:hypothetical protein
MRASSLVTALESRYLFYASIEPGRVGQTQRRPTRIPQVPWFHLHLSAVFDDADHDGYRGSLSSTILSGALSCCLLE